MKHQLLPFAEYIIFRSLGEALLCKITNGDSNEIVIGPATYEFAHEPLERYTGQHNVDSIADDWNLDVIYMSTGHILFKTKEY